MATLTGTASTEVITHVNQGDLGREGFINRYLQQLDNTFELQPAFYKVNILDRLGNTVIGTKDFWVIDAKSSYDEIISTKKVIPRPNTSIEMGEYFQVPDWNNATLMIIDMDISNLYFYKAQSEECNFTLEYINDVGKALRLPCVYTLRNPYSPGTKENKYMQTGSNQRSIFIARNVETMKLDNNRDKELFLNGLLYRIASTDSDEQEGVIKITLTEYQEGVMETHLYSLSILEEDISLSVGQTRQLDVIAREDSREINRPLAYSSSDETIATVSDSGLITSVANGDCTISVKFRDNEAISDSVSVNVADVPVDNVEYRFNVDSPTFIKNFITERYNFNKFNNDVIEPVDFVFTIDYGSVDDSVATLTVIDSNNVDIKANSRGMTGNIFLVATEGGIERGRLQINVISIYD